MAGARVVRVVDFGFVLGATLKVEVVVDAVSEDVVDSEGARSEESV